MVGALDPPVPDRAIGGGSGGRLGALRRTIRPMRAVTDPDQREGLVSRFLRFWVPVLLLVFVVRSFLFQPFHIPSESMMATLLVGDSLFVSKFSYGYSRYSFPFSPP